jgi:hypothetical protein
LWLTSDPTVSFDAMADTAPTSVVYVLGAARGGTTIVGRVLGSLDGVAFGGELRRLWGPAQRPGRTCGCGRTLDACEVWSKVRAGASGLDDATDILRLQRSVAPRHLWWHAWRMTRSSAHPPPNQASYLAALSDLYHAFARATGVSVVVDTSKKAPDAALLPLGPSLSAHCVQVVRDPRGVVYSRRKRTTPGEASRPRPLASLRTALHWVVTQMAAEAVRRRYGPERSVLVRYEEFADDPTPVLRTVARLVGVRASEPVPVGQAIEVGVGHGPDGNGRFKDPYVVLRRDDAWRTELHPLDRTLITLVTYPLLRRYGVRVRVRGSSGSVGG